MDDEPKFKSNVNCSIVKLGCAYQVIAKFSSIILDDDNNQNFIDKKNSTYAKGIEYINYLLAERMETLY